MDELSREDRYGNRYDGSRQIRTCSWETSEFQDNFGSNYRFCIDYKNKTINILNEIEHSQDLRLVILSSNGKNFSAGADLNWMKRMSNASYDENMRDASSLTTMLQKLNNLAQPTLVIIKGAVFGGGVGLVSCCDISIASNESIFSLSEVKVGLVPATIGPYVIQAIGERNARRFFLTGERFGAEVAREINLVHEVTAVSYTHLTLPTNREV